MSSFSALEIGKRALLAQRLGLDVTSNNIANVKTPGYARRAAVVSEATPTTSTNGVLAGNGAQIDKIRSFRDEYYDREIRTTTSRMSGYDADIEMYQQIESVLVEPSDSGINEQLTNFFKAFEEVAQQPEKIGYRNNLLSISKTLTEKFNYTSKQLSELRTDAKSKIQDSVKKMNQLLSDIASLNAAITSARNTIAGETQTFVDQRNSKIEELAQLANVTVATSEKGSQNVFLGGINILTDNTANEIQLKESINNITGESTLSLEKIDKENSNLTALEAQAGDISSLMKHFNVTLDDKDSSGNFSVSSGLHDLAKSLAENVNAITINGYGLNDKGTNPPGISYFTPTVGEVNAYNIAVNEDLMNNPQNIPLSSAPNEAGNGELANAIGRLAYNDNFINNQTVTDYYANYLGKIGNLSKEANNGKTTTELIYNQLDSQRESIIGVNLDEEAVNLVKYQKAFEAASRVVNTTNEILSTIINLGR